MKKNLLLVAALFCSVAMSAQTTWSGSSTLSGSDLAQPVNIAASATASNINASDISWGDGISTPAKGQKNYTDISGSGVPYIGDGTEGVIKWQPTVASGEECKTLEGVYATNQYVSFKIAINNDVDFVTLKNVTFDSMRFGTDAVRINARLFATGDMSGAYETDWLITEENCPTLTNGTAAWIPIDETGATTPIVGCVPSREKAESPNSTLTGRSSFNIPVPSNFPEDAIDAELRIYVYGIASNKQFGLLDVKMNTVDGTGIQDNVSIDESVAAKYYTVSGIEVQEPVKGINIVKRTMTDGSVKFTKEIK